jgi:hypothetical protein
MLAVAHPRLPDHDTDKVTLNAAFATQFLKKKIQRWG